MNERILVIDDTKNIKMLIGKALASEGYGVDTAESGQEGIELFKTQSYDLVLLDIRMPNMSGTEVLRVIKDIDEAVPVAIITAFPTVKNAVECIKLGAVDYLRKPFTAEKIKQVIKQILDRKEITPQNTNNHEACIEYAKKCINERKFDEGMEYLKKAIALNIDNADPFNILGEVFELKGDIVNAKKYYGIALQLEPGNETAIENLNRVVNRS
ncbi:MAG: sigma-54-dependent transcriptional response regulator [Clostridiales bacterium]|jgi:DNA-binding NtrC family response regulator|nr:sigma-54-dependent transcriptional response regulator [Clostridiales bacterium]